MHRSTRTGNGVDGLEHESGSHLSDKWGILAAWAYSESILDVRALLEGRKIAWIKNAEQWTTGINQTSEAVDGFAMAKDCENGWDYMKYLKFLVSMKKIVQ